MSKILIEGLQVDDLLAEFRVIKNGLHTIADSLKEKKKPTDYLTRQDVSKMFQVSLVTIGDWTAKGLLKSYKLANRVYYKRGEIEQALTEISPKR